MKHLLTLNNFLNEYHIETDFDISVDYINSKLDYKWGPSNTQIYKGTYESYNSHLFHIENTEREGQGMSKNIISKLPSWSKFSNRYKSIVSTTNYNYANSWGYVFSVIPLKNEIFVGISRDFNAKKSFPFFDNVFFNDNTSAGFMIIYDVIEKLNIYKNNNIIPNINSVEDILDLSNEQSEKIFKLVKNRKLKKLIKENNFKNMLELFDYIFDPIRNGYKKMKYTDFIKNKDPNVEVWFECDCFLINDTHLFSWLDRYGTH